MTLIGASVPRLEDRALITGRGRFAADISFPGQLHMRVVRSPVAHGRIRSIDSADVYGVDGVVAVWTSADVAGIPPIDFRQEGLSDLYPYRQPVLATGVVRYVGEPVAVVFAENAYVAEDAADLVFVDVEELPAIVDPRAEPASFDEHHGTRAADITISYGDIDGAFRAASEHVLIEVAIGRHTGVPLEARGSVATYDHTSGRIELHGAAKVPHYNRSAIAKMLGVTADSVVLHEGHVGGGFGVRGELYPEDVLLCLAAQRLRRPVKWIEDRREHLMATNHSRDQIHRIEAAVDETGFVHAIRDEFWVDQGAYVRTHASTVPNLTVAMLPGPYVVPAYEVTGHIALTNKTPAGTYRSPGRYEATFARERLFDAVAARLGKDPVEVRRRNLIRPEQMPFARPIRALGTDLEYDSGDYPLLLDKALKELEARGFRENREERRAAGDRVGLGVALFVEKSGLGPFDGVRITVDPSGTVRIVTGAASVGQGVETVVAQICAETLGVDIARVRVSHGQTDEIERGMGAFASRVTVMTGTATYMAATALRDKVLACAADVLQTSRAELRIVDGYIEVAGRRQDRVPLGEIAAALDHQRAARLGVEPGLSAESWFTSHHMTYPYGLHAALVVVDEDSGEARILRYFVAYDVGRAVNPMLVAGQIVGGAAQGIGGALLEEFVYDPAGQPLATSFMDYLMPTVAEMPPVDVLITEDAPSPRNPLGVKGAGEGGTAAAGAAVAAAIDDALGISGAVTRLPVTPERMRAIVRSNATSSSP